MAKERSPFIAIPASLGGIFMIIVVLFLIFAADQLVFLADIAWAFVILGAVALFFAYLASILQKKKKK